MAFIDHEFDETKLKLLSNNKVAKGFKTLFLSFPNTIQYDIMEVSTTFETEIIVTF